MRKIYKTILGCCSQINDKNSFWLLFIITIVFCITVFILFLIVPLNWAFCSLIAFIFWFALLTRRDLNRFLFILLILSLPVEFGFHLVHREVNPSGSGGIYISLTFLIATAILLNWMFELAAKKTGKMNYFSSVTIPAMLFIFAGILSMVNTSDKFLSVSGIFHYAKAFLVYFIAAKMVRNEDDVKLVIRVLLIVLVLESLVYITQNIGRIGGGRGGEVLYRARGTMDSPSLMATFFSSVLLMAIGVKFIKTRTFLKTLVIIAFFTGIPGLIITFCRAPIIDFCVCMVLGTWYGLRRKWVRWRTIAGLLGAVGIAVLLLWPMISVRASADHTAALEERMNLMRIAWNIIEDHPIIGIGINTYNERYKAYIPDELKDTWVYPVHNQYLLIWAETGTLGIITFVWFLLAVIKKGIRCAKRKNDLLAPLSLGYLLGFLAILLDMFWGIYVSEQATLYMWFLAGLIVAMEKLDIRRKQKENSYVTA